MENLALRKRCWEDWGKHAMVMQAVEDNLQTVKPVRKLGVQKEELVEDMGRTTKANA